MPSNASCFPFDLVQVDNDDYTQRPLQAYTFASPRVGDAKLCTYLTKSLQFTAVQVKNKPDAVPFVPPTGMLSLRLIVSWTLLPGRGRYQRYKHLCLL